MIYLFGVTQLCFEDRTGNIYELCQSAHQYVIRMPYKVVVVCQTLPKVKQHL